MKRLRDEEQGAVLAIVAISLLALLGMVVLTFDLGRGVALKRNMVNAADAGALAAARECGLANGTGPAETAAKDLIADNNSSATLVGAPQFDSASQCEGKGGAGERQVRVTVSVLPATTKVISRPASRALAGWTASARRALTAAEPKTPAELVTVRVVALREISIVAVSEPLAPSLSVAVKVAVCGPVSSYVRVAAAPATGAAPSPNVQRPARPVALSARRASEAVPE